MLSPETRQPFTWGSLRVTLVLDASGPERATAFPSNQHSQRPSPRNVAPLYELLRTADPSPSPSPRILREPVDAGVGAKSAKRSRRRRDGLDCHVGPAVLMTFSTMAANVNKM